MMAFPWSSPLSIMWLWRSPLSGQGRMFLTYRVCIQCYSIWGLMGERAQQQWMTFAFWFASSLASSCCPNGNFVIVACLFMFWHVKLIFVLYAWWAVCCLNMESTVSLLSLCTIERQEYGTMGPGLLRTLFTSIKTIQVSSLGMPILVLWFWYSDFHELTTVLFR
jgi:hypothetical protein